MGRTSRFVYRLVPRIAALWAAEVLALWGMAQVLPGLSLEGWRAGVIAVAVIALLNALVRPVLLYLTLPITVLSFGILTLILNAIVLWLAAMIVPDLHVAGLGPGVVAALGLSTVNTIVAAVLAFDDEDSVYRSIIRRVARRSLTESATTPGLIFIEFDGVSADLMERAMRDGYAPTLASWRKRNGYRIVPWDCGVPSQTSSSQAGILFGNNFDIPAFRWFEKSTREMIVSNDPAHARRIEERVSRGAGLLRGKGISICNMFTGDADKYVATISSFSSPGHMRSTAAFYFSFYLNPYNFTRALVLMIADLAVERWESLHQRMHGALPRVSREGTYPILRVISTIAQRELITYTLMREMFAGVPVAYVTYVGYDVVAHHAGPETHDALRVLRKIDRRVAMLARAASESPRPYRFVLLSDHGQTRSIPFRQRHGASIDAVVRTLVNERQIVHAQIPKAEGSGHMSALITEAIRYGRLEGSAARRILERRLHERRVQLGTAPAPARGDVVVCASGNLALIYFADIEHRLSLEEIAQTHPGLIQGLVAHDGIGFVMARSAQHGPVVMGRAGVHYLREGRIDGEDPLAGYGPYAARQLARLEDFPHCGDVVLNGRYHAETGMVESFEEMVGSHGGLGGLQTQGFLMCPRSWSLPAEEITNPEVLYQVFVRWRDALAAGTEPAGGHMDALAADSL